MSDVCARPWSCNAAVAATSGSPHFAGASRLFAQLLLELPKCPTSFAFGAPDNIFRLHVALENTLHRETGVRIGKQDDRSMARKMVDTYTIFLPHLCGDVQADVALLNAGFLQQVLPGLRCALGSIRQHRDSIDRNPVPLLPAPLLVRERPNKRQSQLFPTPWLEGEAYTDAFHDGEQPAGNSLP